MDSLTQIVLGAAAGEIILGRKLGNKAQLLGAIAGTLPDMDVLYNFYESDPVKHLVVHRGYSHSVFTHILVSFPLAWLSRRWSKKEKSFGIWYLFWFAGLFTHALLDCCTTYGTQLFLPFTNYQVAFNNISVIDPLYTIPFMFLLMVCLFIRRDRPLRRKFLWASVIFSSAYMFLTFVLKYDMHQRFRKSLQQNKIEYAELNTTPTILNAVLWSAIAYSDSMIYCAEYSYLNSKIPVQWILYKRNLDLLKEFDCYALQKVIWFSDGNYFVEKSNADTLAFYNIKWGRTRFDVTDPGEAFFFYMLFYKEDGKIKYSEVSPGDWSFKEAFAMLAKRIGI